MSNRTLHYFAVGGTGALSVEPLLLLCAAGIGPSRLAVTLIDADAANPSFARAQALLKLYSEVRQAFDSPVEGFFRTELIRTKRSESVWSPLGAPGAPEAGDLSLERFVERARMAGENRDAGILFDLLFSVEQQKEQLREGFRGNPAIGSILMHGLKESTFFRELMNSARGDTTAAFFVTGSVFGGTGASALPVLAEVLVSEGIEPSRIGAAVVTPYFSLAEPSQRERQDGRLKPDSSVFLRNTAAALPTYTRGLSRYGSLYVVGDEESLPRPRSTYSAGGPTQRNDPHVVELYAALAALDFARDERRDPATATAVHYVTTGSAEPSWSDLPLQPDERRELLTFAVAANFFLTYFGLTRNGAEQQDLIDELKTQPWTKHIGLAPQFVRTDAGALDLLGRYFAATWGYLWAATHNYVALRLVSFATRASRRVPTPQEYASVEREADLVLPRIDNCLDGYSPPRKGGMFGLFKRGEDQLESDAQMFRWFNQVRREDVKGLHGFLTYLHDGTRLFTDEWYSPTTRAHAG
jgi:hypothetical protein